MPTAPDLAAVKTYLGTNHSFTDPEIIEALNAEKVAQTNVVRLPADPLTGPVPYPADLAQALMRRVKRSLEMKNHPLGMQQMNTEFGAINTRIGKDPEITRLEAPYRKRRVG